MIIGTRLWAASSEPQLRVDVLSVSISWLGLLELLNGS